jgi:hypothetical protein
LPPEYAQSTPDKEAQMKKIRKQPEIYDCLEYHGSTAVERIRKLAGRVIWREWVFFDSAREAREYYCGNA